MWHAVIMGMHCLSDDRSRLSREIAQFRLCHADIESVPFIGNARVNEPVFCVDGTWMGPDHFHYRLGQQIIRGTYFA